MYDAYDPQEVLDIVTGAQRTGELKWYMDWFGALRYIDLKNRKNIKKEQSITALRSAAMLAMKTAPREELPDYYNLIGNTYLYEAPYNFDSYCIALEWNRPPEKKFYQPRRQVLKRLADDMQDLADGKLDLLAISMPPRTGKSTLSIFYLTWRMGKWPDDANLMSGHSDKLTDGFYSEVLSIITDEETYRWHDIFPGVQLADKSAKNETVDLNKKKRFPTLTCRSIGGTLTGAVEVGEHGMLYCDDLVEDLEEAINPLRMDAKWDAYLNQLKDRKKRGATELHIATRWSTNDPIGRLRDQYRDNPRYRFTVIPAIDADGHSNFNYAQGVGFDDAYYADMKESIDDATWCAKYMGDPYVREGLVFPREELRWYNGVLPDGEPDQRIMVADIAWGGGDYTAAPIAYIYGNDVYVVDVVFNNGDKTVTKPEMVGKIQQFKPQRFRGEANNGGDEYTESLDDMLRNAGYRLNIRSQRAPTTSSKLGRIIQYSPEIKRFWFIDDKHSGKEYRAFMDQVCIYTQTGKNVHDDAPDSLAMLADEIYAGIAKIEAFKRPF